MGCINKPKACQKVAGGRSPAETTGNRQYERSTPKGVPEHSAIQSLCDPFRVGILSVGDRWCRSAQPPATVCQPFGLRQRLESNPLNSSSNLILITVRINCDMAIPCPPLGRYENIRPDPVHGSTTHAHQPGNFSLALIKSQKDPGGQGPGCCQVPEGKRGVAFLPTVRFPQRAGHGHGLSQ